MTAFPASQAGATVLAVNAGSSSLKFGLYPVAGQALWKGQFEGLEPGGTPVLKLDGEAPRAVVAREGQVGFDAALLELAALLESGGAGVAAVAHRIVHGGDRCVAPCRLDESTLAYLQTLNPLAPLHQPHNLAGVEAFTRVFPGVVQIGCFDTAFHATLPAVERRLPIARALADQGLRRFGFHGLSYQYVAGELKRATQRMEGRALLAHLGSGASLCATRGGRSVGTTMGFSALDGLMMGTRSGSLDPGVLLYLWREGWDLARVEQLLYKSSGLKGVSGLSADMRSLRASSRPEAAEAIALFTHRVIREAGALTAVLGGLDVLGFTGGIGEHDAVLRAAVVEGLAFAGLRVDPERNVAATGDQTMAIHASDSCAEIWVVPTDEGRVAAASAFRLLATPTFEKEEKPT